MNQKINTKLGVALIVIFVVTVGVFVWKYEKIKFIELPQIYSSGSNRISNPKKEDEVRISANWTLVSHENFWNNPEKFKKPNGDRFPNVSFFYPDNWEFQCCGDMDHASENFIRPLGRNKSLPYIRIITYVLRGCQNPSDRCSLDKQVIITADEKFDRLVSAVPKEQILPKKKLENLNTSAFVYQKTEDENRSSKAYLINFEGYVIEIDFVNYESLGDTFIEKFLNQMSLEDK